MGAFVLLTIFLIQKGSSESKQESGDPRDEDPRRHRTDPDAPWPVRRGGLWLVAYENSLLIAFTVLFAGSFLGHAVSGAHEYTVEQHEHGAPVSEAGSSCACRSSGSSRSRTGRASSSRSVRSCCCRCSSASAARPSRNPFTQPTGPRAIDLPLHSHGAEHHPKTRARSGPSADIRAQRSEGLSLRGWMANVPEFALRGEGMECLILRRGFHASGLKGGHP